MKSMRRFSQSEEGEFYSSCRPATQTKNAIPLRIHCGVFVYTFYSKIKTPFQVTFVISPSGMDNRDGRRPNHQDIKYRHFLTKQALL